MASLNLLWKIFIFIENLFEVLPAILLELNERLETKSSIFCWYTGKSIPWLQVETMPISVLLLTLLHFGGGRWT
jgi:hypothetical protein